MSRAETLGRWVGKAVVVLRSLRLRVSARGDFGCGRRPRWGASLPPAFSITCSPMTIPSGATTVVPGNWRFLPETKNIGLHLTHGLNNSSLEILAIHLADGRPCLMLDRHGYQCFYFAGSLVPYDTHCSDLAEGTERVTQGVFACLTRQVCYTDVHSDSLL